MQARGWIEKAEHDLRNAQYVITLENDCPFDTICYHCQQSAEKYLKAVLVYHGTDFPRTHDLIVLANLIARKVKLDISVEQIRVLNRYSIEARYPGEWDPIDKQEATDALGLARLIRGAVLRVLSTDFPQEKFQ